MFSMSISPAELARALHVDVMSVTRWKRGVHAIPGFLALALCALEHGGGEQKKGTRKRKGGKHMVAFFENAMANFSGSSITATASPTANLRTRQEKAMQRNFRKRERVRVLEGRFPGLEVDSTCFEDLKQDLIVSA